MCTYIILTYFFLVAIIPMVTNASEREIPEELRSSIAYLIDLTNSTNIIYYETFSLLKQYAINNLRNSHPNLSKTIEDDVEYVISSMLNQTIEQEVVEELISLNAKYFTHAEIEELITFYQMPIGQKLVQISPQFAIESLHIGQALSQRMRDKLSVEINRLLAAKPQQPPIAPQPLKLAADMKPTELAEAGEKLFYGQATCALCHTIGRNSQRGPDLAGIGARATQRIQEANYRGTAKTGAEYLVESLHIPSIYVAPGYRPTMPALGRQMADLEIIAIVAFMQSLGGDITVNGHTRFPQYRGAD